MYPYGYSVGKLSLGDEVKDRSIEVHCKPLEDSDVAAVYTLDNE